VQRVSAGVASLLMSMTPVFTLALGALLLGERPTPLGIAGLVAAFAGVALVAATLDGGGRSELLGVTYMLLGAASWSAGIVLMRLMAGGLTRSTFVAWQTMLGIPVLAVAAAVIEGFTFVWSLPFALGVFYAGAFSKGTSFFLQLTIVRLSTATVASLVAFLIPVFGTLAGVVLLGETVRAGQVYGGAVILVGVGLVLRAGAAASAASPAPAPAA
jgi:probable blue pigment (indigoidine) exporter